MAKYLIISGGKFPRYTLFHNYTTLNLVFLFPWRFEAEMERMRVGRWHCDEYSDEYYVTLVAIPRRPGNLSARLAAKNPRLVVGGGIVSSMITRQGGKMHLAKLCPEPHLCIATSCVSVPAWRVARSEASDGLYPVRVRSGTASQQCDPRSDCGSRSERHDMSITSSSFQLRSSTRSVLTHRSCYPWTDCQKVN